MSRLSDHTLSAIIIIDWLIALSLAVFVGLIAVALTDGSPRYDGGLLFGLATLLFLGLPAIIATGELRKRQRFQPAADRRGSLRATYGLLLWILGLIIFTIPTLIVLLVVVHRRKTMAQGGPA